jgi:hypothetical protein
VTSTCISDHFGSAVSFYTTLILTSVVRVYSALSQLWLRLWLLLRGASVQKPSIKIVQYSCLLLSKLAIALMI